MIVEMLRMKRHRFVRTSTAIRYVDSNVQIIDALRATNFVMVSIELSRLSFARSDETFFFFHLQ